MLISDSNSKKHQKRLQMGEEEDRLPFLSLKDFEKRGIKINGKWSGLEALVAVACLASEKLKEEKIRKEEEEKERKSVESNGCLSRLVACNGFEYGSSSRSSNDRRACLRLARVSDRNERNKSLEKAVRSSLPKLSIKKKQGFDADFDKPGSAPGRKDKHTCLARVSDRREREKALKKPVTNSVPEKKLGFHKVSSRDKLLGDAMKVRILPWDDEEWTARYEKPKQNLKRKVSRRDNNEERDSKSNKKMKRPFRYIVPEVTTDLPQVFKEKIENLNGSNINLVIQKILYSSDLSDHQSRLLIPWKQILSMEKFLNDEERIRLNKEHSTILVKVIEPSLEECEMTLKQRKMDKKKGKKSSLSYVLITQWKYFKNRNDLEVGDIIQVWSFRRPGDELCLAFVLVGKGGQIGEENNKNHHGDLDGGNTSEGNGNGSNEGTESAHTQGSTPTP